LITGVSPSDFYILDKCLLLPSFLLTIGLLQPKELKLTFSKIRRNLIPYKAMLLLGFFWLTSSALYGFALSLEKTTIVFIIRNLSYPLAAIIGAFWFKEHITLKRAIGFALITLSAVLGVLF